VKTEGDYTTNDKIIANWTKVLAISTILLFLATLGTGYVLHRTDVTIGKQLSIMQAQLAATEREHQPLITFSKDDEGDSEPFLTEFPKGSLRIGWNFRFQNAGKGGAQNLTMMSYLKIGDGKFSAGFKGAPVQMDSLEPGAKGYITTLADGTFSDAQFRALKSKDDAIGRLVEITYFDIFGKFHEIAFCNYMLATGARSHPNASECKKQKS
jgi:hypothetical protein